MNHQETWDALLDEFGSDADMPLALGQWLEDTPPAPVEGEEGGEAC
jgi:hypothetical protein